MIRVDKIDTGSKADVRRYIRVQYNLYEGHPQWVPPILIDRKAQLNKKKHPFYEHSDADFFIANRDGEDGACVGAIENRPYNKYHDKKQAQFYLFDCVNDQEVATKLFERVFEWARERGLTQVVGPKGFGPLDGYGLLVEGFEHRQMMTMMNYNFDYYPELVENLGFRKLVDFVSHYINRDTFEFPERIHSIAERVLKRGRFQVKRFKNKRELVSWGSRIGDTYNKAFVNNWEYYPLTKNEIDFVIDSIITIADYRLMKIVTYDDEVVGFLFAFPDVSAALQRSGGKLLPFGIFDLLLELKRTDWVSFNGAGVLPEHQGRGGNAIMYSEMVKTIKDYGFKHCDLTQVAESAVQMRRDLENIGGKAFKNHRVYIKDL
jgi:GNAT superfamily N-acetyltransferase